MLKMAIAIVLLALARRLAAPQPPTPGIKVEVDLVLVNVVVTDAEGRYVVGLEKENFQVWEDRLPSKSNTSRLKTPRSASV